MWQAALEKGRNLAEAVSEIRVEFARNGDAREFLKGVIMKKREEILKLIERNSKFTAEDLSVMLDWDLEEVEEEIRKMEEENIICGYPTVINWDDTDEERVTALIEVKVTPQRGKGFEKIAQRIYKFNEVESVYLMSGGFDLAVTVKGKSLKEVARFVSTKLAPMETIMSTGTHFVLKKYKENGLPLVKEVSGDERMPVTP